MNLENMLKGWFTTLAGMFLMAMASYDYFFTDVLTEREAIGSAVCGFALLWMRDKISDWIGQLFQAAIEKFKSK